MAHPLLLNLLLVEDNAEDAALVVAQLRAANFEVRARIVTTAAEFLAALTPEPDVILCDHHLPQFDGRQALELLKARAIDVPFILVSGTVGEDLAAAYMRNGAADYLLKDRLARLGSAVSRVLEEKRLRAREHRTLAEMQRLAAIVRSSDDAILSFTPQGMITSWNHGAQRMFGYSADEMVGNDVNIIVPPAEREQVRANFEHLREGRRIAHFETVRLHKNGTEIQVSIAASPVRDAEGEVRGVATVMRDIGGLKAAMAALERKTSLSQMLAAAAAQAGSAAGTVEALAACLALLCKHGAWAIGHVVTFRPDGAGMLPLHTLWEMADRARYAAFIAESERFDYAMGRGDFIGQAMRSHQPVWIADINASTHLTRTALLKPLGIRCAVAIPVLAGGKVAALIEMFAEQARAPDTLLLESLPSLTAQLARVIERARAGEALGRDLVTLEQK